MDEIWKPVKGYEGLYEVSSFGRVKSLGRITKRKQGTRVVEIYKPEVVLSQLHGGKKRNYLFVNLYQEKTENEPRKHKQQYVHRLVAEAFIPNPQNKKDVNHIDGNPGNNYVTNLEWNTRKENIHHAFEHGLTKNYGSNHYQAKLTEKQVIEIRSKYVKGQKGSGYIALAKQYNVTPELIRNIVRGKIWKRVCIL